MGVDVELFSDQQRDHCLRAVTPEGARVKDGRNVARRVHLQGYTLGRAGYRGRRLIEPEPELGGGKDAAFLGGADADPDIPSLFFAQPLLLLAPVVIVGK